MEEGTQNCHPNLCGSSLSSGGLPHTGTGDMESQCRRGRDELVMGLLGRQDLSAGIGKEEAMSIRPLGLKGEQMRRNQQRR